MIEEDFYWGGRVRIVLANSGPRPILIHLYFNYKRKSRWRDRMSPYEILASREEQHRFKRY
jgi:hypothetical protein